LFHRKKILKQSVSPMKPGEAEDSAQERPDKNTAQRMEKHAEKHKKRASRPSKKTGSAFSNGKKFVTLPRF